MKLYKNLSKNYKKSKDYDMADEAEALLAKAEMRQAELQQEYDKLMKDYESGSYIDTRHYRNVLLDLAPKPFMEQKEEDVVDWEDQPVGDWEDEPVS